MIRFDPGRVAGMIMPASFAVAIVFCSVRMAQSTTHQYFAQPPSLHWQKPDTPPLAGSRNAPVITWRCSDESASWMVRYRLSKTSAWRTAYAKVVDRVNSDLLTKHSIYTATLADAEPGKPIDYQVYRNQTPVYTAKTK